MLRYVLSVIAGYAAMAVVVMAGFAVAFVAPDFAYQKDSLDVSTGWLVYTLVLSLVGAIVGGFVCGWIARDYRPVVALAALALAFGLFEAARNAGRARPTKSPQEIAAMSMMDKAQISVQPTAYAWTLPFVGAAGVLIGGRMRMKT
jgi:hypothetical protein